MGFIMMYNMCGFCTYTYAQSLEYYSIWVAMLLLIYIVIRDTAILSFLGSPESVLTLCGTRLV
jgi:cytochrome c biogenesis protein CcdA